MIVKQRTICLVPIPFTDLHSFKRRPVLVLSNNEYNRKDDLIVSAITSNINYNDYSIKIEQKNMETGKLLKTSMVRFDKIYTIHKSLIIKEFGLLEKSLFNKIVKKIERIIN